MPTCWHRDGWHRRWPVRSPLIPVAVLRSDVLLGTLILGVGVKLDPKPPQNRHESQRMQKPACQAQQHSEIVAEPRLLELRSDVLLKSTFWMQM